VNSRLLLLAACCVALSALAGEIPLNERRSGYEMMSHETQAIQDDDATNPGILGVLDGEALWRRKAGAADRACADCHQSIKGVAARYPAFDPARGRPVSLEQRINACRVEKQKAQAFAYESKELLALTAYVARQSRGLPIAVKTDEKTKRFLEAGREAFHRRQGQLNLSCSLCHDDNWGKHLAGSVIPQAHPTGYPIYRLEWQSLGSLDRRLRNCLFGMRAQVPAFGADELVDLELYLMWRARGMKIEAPAVRP
jgi:L-cysteine S-thiosulfotransferase